MEDLETIIEIGDEVPFVTVEFLWKGEWVGLEVYPGKGEVASPQYQTAES